MSHAGHARNFEWTLRLLAERGHEVTVLLERADVGKARERPLARIAADHPTMRIVVAPKRERFSRIGTSLRVTLDYLRYLDPAYAEAKAARDRAAQRTPHVLRTIAGARLFASPRGRSFLRSVLALAEEGVPTSKRLRQLVRDIAPDVVLVTPLVELGSPQTEYVDLAAQLAIPSILLVASWDNLTMKGGVHRLPDLVAVWNEAQRLEAQELHGVHADRVVVVGASAWDHWFDQEPSRGRAAFCEQVGLDPARPYVLYACSSSFLAPDEASFIVDWISDVRPSDAPDPQVLVRPHPTQPFDEADRAALLGLGGVAIHPPAGEIPDDDESRREYFDSITHSSAVVGVNTSAMIEATIADRPVLAVPFGRYRSTQSGTLHFHYLSGETGGPVEVSSDPAVHRAQLERAIAEPGAGSDARGAFITSFIRPGGLATTATATLVDTVERVAHTRVEPRRRAPIIRRGTAFALALATRAAAAFVPEPAERTSR